MVVRMEKGDVGSDAKKSEGGKGKDREGGMVEEVR